MPQISTVDCGLLAVLFLLAAAVVGISHAEVSTWNVDEVTAAGLYLRARIAVDLFGVSEAEVCVRARIELQRAEPALATNIENFAASSFLLVACTPPTRLPMKMSSSSGVPAAPAARGSTASLCAHPASTGRFALGARVRLPRTTRPRIRSQHSNVRDARSRPYRRRRPTFLFDAGPRTR